jgi:hypothetical protein
MEHFSLYQWHRQPHTLICLFCIHMFGLHLLCCVFTSKKGYVCSNSETVKLLQGWKNKQNVKCVRYDIDGESDVLLVAVVI